MSSRKAPEPGAPPVLQEMQVILDLPTQSSNHPPNQSPSPDTTTHHHQRARTRAREESPDYAQYPTTAIEGVLDDLRALGFVGSRQWLALGWPLEAVAETIAEVKAAMEVSEVRNPAGLIRYHVRKQFPEIRERTANAQSQET